MRKKPFILGSLLTDMGNYDKTEKIVSPDNGKMGIALYQQIV